LPLQIWSYFVLYCDEQVDGFPGDIVFFMRVLDLLRGLSSLLGAQVVYLEVMRPFAEMALYSGNVVKSGRLLEISSWICNTPSHSPTETKLRELLVELGRKQQVLGVQVWLSVFLQIELSQRVWVKMVTLKRYCFAFMMRNDQQLLEMFRILSA
jgi:hypothetical protein